MFVVLTQKQQAAFERIAAYITDITKDDIEIYGAQHTAVCMDLEPEDFEVCKVIVEHGWS
jgi:hypothetical protein